MRTIYFQYFFPFLHKCIRSPLITIWINQDHFFYYYNFLIMPLSQQVRDINDKLYVIITAYSSFKISIDISLPELSF